MYCQGKALYDATLVSIELALLDIAFNFSVVVVVGLDWDMFCLL